MVDGSTDGGMDNHYVYITPCQRGFYKVGLNSVKDVIHLMVLILCDSSDHALYLYQVLGKYLQVFQSY